MRKRFGPYDYIYANSVEFGPVRRLLEAIMSVEMSAQGIGHGARGQGPGAKQGVSDS